MIRPGKTSRGGSARSKNRTRVQAFLRRGGFGMAPALRQIGPPPWRNAAFLIGLSLVLIEFGLFFGWHLSRVPNLSAPWFGFLGSNGWRNQVLHSFALSLRETFGLWPEQPLPDLPWVADCLRLGASGLVAELQHNCTVFLDRVVASVNRPAEWWRLGSYMFLHAGLLHLALNILAYRMFAMTVLRRCGNLRFVGFFILCGVAAGLAHFGLRFAYDELLIAIGIRDAPSASLQFPLVGASGAIMGLWLACLRIQYDRLRRITPAKRPIQPRAYLKRVFINVLAINILFVLTQSLISGEAHLGGALVGFLLAPVFFTRAGALNSRKRGFVRLGRWGLQLRRQR